MFGPFLSDELMECAIEMNFDPDIPGADDGQKKQQIRPPQKEAEAHPRLVITDRQNRKRRCRKDQPMRTFRQTRERGANPETGEPDSSLTSLLEAAEPAIDRSGEERTEKWLRHDNATENECPAQGEVNQPGCESAPVVGQSLADQKREYHRRHHRQCNRNTRGCSVDAKEFIAGDDQPVKQRRLLQARNAVVCRQ